MHLSGFFLRKSKVGAECGGANVAFGIGEGGFDEHDIAALLFDTSAERELRVERRDGAKVARLHLARYAGGLEFAHHDPSAYFVEQDALNTAVERIEPALVSVGGCPEADDIVAVFEELHFYAERILRRAAEAVVAFEAEEGVDDFIHSEWFVFISYLLLDCGFCKASHNSLHPLRRLGFFQVGICYAVNVSLFAKLGNESPRKRKSQAFSSYCARLAVSLRGKTLNNSLIYTNL